MKEPAPRVSIIMPVYNAEAYVDSAIRSILEQTFGDFEFIIIDDASTDGSPEIIQGFDDPRIRYYRNEENLHLSRSINRGLDYVRGEYVARMDADDIALPHRLQTQFSFLQAHPDVALCGSWVEAFGEASKVLERPADHDAIKAYMLFSNPMIHPSVFAKRAVFDTVRYDRRYDKSEDYALWIEAIELFRFANIPEVLLRYRVHHNQVSTAQVQGQLSNGFLLKQNMLRQLGCDADEKTVQRHLLLGHRGDRDAFRIEEIDPWLAQIVACNRRTGYVSEEALLDAIRFFLWKRLNEQTFRGLGLLWPAYASRFMRVTEIPFIEHVKFAAKCLLRYRRR